MQIVKMQKLADPQGAVAVIHLQMAAHDQRRSTEEEVAKPMFDRRVGHQSREGGSNSKHFRVMNRKCAALLDNDDHKRKNSRFLCGSCGSCAAYSCGSNLGERVLNCTYHSHKHMVFLPLHIGTNIRRWVSLCSRNEVLV